MFSDASCLDQVLPDNHTIDGRTVEVKRAIAREKQNSSYRTGNFNADRSLGDGGNIRTKKLFVGGLPYTLTEDEFRQCFESYGYVTDVVIMYDQNTQRSCGFGFITFDTEVAGDSVLQMTLHKLKGKLVEVQRALPKDSNSGGGRYQGYGPSGGNTSTLDDQMNGNRYMQPQTTVGYFPHYSGYDAQSYGYGAANCGFGYGGYGSYGVFGGYGSAEIGFGGETWAYGTQIYLLLVMEVVHLLT